MSDTAVEFASYPYNGTESVLRSVVLGPGSDEFVFLMEMNPDTEEVKITLGNGPDNADIPTVVPDLLREVSDIIEDLGNRDEFWEQVAATSDDRSAPKPEPKDLDAE